MARPKKTPEEIVEELTGEKAPVKETPKEPPKFISVRFRWSEFRPDKRQYNQQTLLLSPHQTWIIVEVPNTDEYVIQNNSLVDAQPELTPLGMRYCADQLDAVFSEDVVEEDVPDWGSVEENTEKEDSWEDTWDDSKAEDTEEDTWDTFDTDDEEDTIDNDTEEEFDWE